MDNHKIIKMTFEMRAEIREVFNADDPMEAGRAVRKVSQYLDTCLGVIPESVRFEVEER